MQLTVKEIILISQFYVLQSTLIVINRLRVSGKYKQTDTAIAGAAILKFRNRL